MRPTADIINDHEAAKARNDLGRLREINSEARRRFDAKSEINGELMEAGDLKASDQRTFDRNLGEMGELKKILAWGDEPAKALGMFSPEARPDQHQGSADMDGCRVGAAKGVRFARQDISDVFDAVSRRQPRNILSVATAPQGNRIDPEYFTYDLARDKMRLLDHMPVGFTEFPQTSYYRVTTGAVAAAAVAAGAPKPESSPVYEYVTSPVVKIAHWGQAYDEVVNDWSGFYEAVSSEYIAGLIDVETSQLLTGTGVAPNLRGIVNTVGVQTQAFSTSIIVTLAKAVTKLRTGTAKTEPDTFVVNASDWEAVTLFRTGGSVLTDGPFLVDPFAPSPTTLWGVPVVVTTRIAAGTAVVANLAMATRVRMRQQPSLEVAPGAGATEWAANLTLIRAEERLGLEVPRPGAIVVATTA